MEVCAPIYNAFFMFRRCMKVFNLINAFVYIGYEKFSRLKLRKCDVNVSVRCIKDYTSDIMIFINLLTYLDVLSNNSC